MNKTYDLVVQLGSRIEFRGTYKLVRRTEMCALAAAYILKKDIAPKLVICGGSKFGVYYDYINTLHPPDLSFEAFAQANRDRLSEAAVIKEYLVTVYLINSKQIFTETVSSTPTESAQFLKIILERRPMFAGIGKIGLLALLHNMEKALRAFKEAGLSVQPVFAENILADHDPKTQIEKICDYYTTPKDGISYNPDRIRRLLTEGKSLKELMT